MSLTQEQRKSLRTSPILLNAATLFAAVFHENPELVIADEQVGDLPLSSSYVSTDLNAEGVPLCLTETQWNNLGELPAGHRLTPVLEHPILQDIFYVAALEGSPEHSGCAEQYLAKKYPDGYQLLGICDSDDPDNAVGYLMHCHWQISMEPEEDFL